MFATLYPAGRALNLPPKSGLAGPESEAGLESETVGVMVSAQPRTTAGREALASVLAHPASTVLATDFDGVLARIVPNPEQAYADPAAIAVLGRLGAVLGRIVVITGRPAETAIRLGDLRGRPGLERLIVLGQYGVERWDADGDRFAVPPPPDDIDDLAADLDALLDHLDLTDATVEHKGRALGVHLRRLPDPDDAMARLDRPIAELAELHGYRVEPGKHVLELRGHGMDKGEALRDIVAEIGAERVVYAGDDLGDLPAFEAVRDLRTRGHAALSVFAASAERDVLRQVCDVEVDGVDGVIAWLTELADRLGHTDTPSRPPVS